MRIRLLSSLTVAAAMAVSLSAHAAPPPPASFSNFDLTLTLDGGEVDWIIPFNQAPSAELFELDGVTPDGAQWSDPETDLANSLLSGPGEFQFFDDGDFEMSLNGGSFLEFTGDIPMISGSATDPDLLPGTYDLKASLGHNAQLTITLTPEPSSMLLLGTGILGVAGVVRRRLNA